jgi:heavy metal sensor kinase
MAVLGFALYAGLKAQLNEAADVDLRSRADAISHFLEQQQQRNRIGDLPHELMERADFDSRNDLSQIRSDDGQFIFQSAGMKDVALPAMHGTMLLNIHSRHRDLRILHRDLHIGNRNYLLDVAVDRSEYVESLEGLASLLLLGIPICLLLAFLVGLWMSGRALLPIQRITNTARSIDDSHLAVRLRLSGSGDELDNLSATLNGMLDRLEGAFERVSRFTADASHELRTPLALIRANVEMLLADPNGSATARRRTADVLQEIDRMRSLIKSLLELASGSMDAAAVVEMIDAADLTVRVAEIGRHLAAEKNIQFHVRQPTAIFPIRGNDAALRRVLVILLDNAIRYTPSGGEVWLEVTSSMKECNMVVRDTGCGIAASDLPNIFERFYRADASRNRSTGGAGLGLSIAREIVKAHGGTIDVDSVVDRGAKFVVSIPSQRWIAG